MIEDPGRRSFNYSLDERYTRNEGAIYLSGLQAIVRLLIDQHRADQRNGLDIGTIVSGYPGSPIGTLDFELNRRSKLLLEHRIHHVPGLNEELAATAVFGGQLTTSIPNATVDGVIGLWYGKAPGVDRTGDAFRHGNWRGMGPNGGIIAVAGDDPAAKSSILPSDSTRVFADMLMPVIFPADVQDVLDLGLHGYALSRACGLAVGMKLVAEVADSAGTALVGPDRIRPQIPSVQLNGRPYLPEMMPNAAGRRTTETVERPLLEGRLALARAYAGLNGLNRVTGAKDAVLGIVAAGKAFLDVVEALSLLGIDPKDYSRHSIRLLKLGVIFPLDPEELREFCSGLGGVMVVEEKRPFIELHLKEALFGWPGAPEVLGKTDGTGKPLLAEHGQLTPETIAIAIAGQLDRKQGAGHFAAIAAGLVSPAASLPQISVMRTGYFCSGCPHTTSLKTPDGMVVGGGIGCHSMAIAMGREEFGNLIGFTQMGGEGAQFVGIAPFSGTQHFFQNLGEGTFAHSGSQALRFAISAGINVTYKILFNSAVAMTGGQEVTGGQTVIGMLRLLETEGVKKVVITTEDPAKYRRRSLPSIASVRHRDDLLDVERELATVPGVTVLLHDQYCAAELRRLRKRGDMPTPVDTVVINERVCEGCGDCGQKSSCLSVIPVETEFGRKTQIHQSSCNKDFSCLKGDCPSFVTVKRSGPKVTKKRPLAELPEASIPIPDPAVPPDHFELFMSGVGGTGVITVNQILGTAGVLDGRSVRVLDSFGGSQKAGPVVSHLKVSRVAAERSASVSARSADVLMVFDVLVGSEPQNLIRASADRTVAIVSTNKAPTGRMIIDPGVEFPAMPIFMKAFEANTKKGQNVYVDAEALALTLLGDHMATNLLLTGVAYQKGLIPLPLDAIERAIELNGVAVDMNKRAFRWGRLIVTHPDLVEKARIAATGDIATPARPDPQVAGLLVGIDGELRTLLELRASDLVRYQDLAYAQRYVEFVRNVAQAEARALPGQTEAAVAVARGLYKLMAYKDEYEVARLHLDSAQQARVREAFGSSAKVYWHLHPPFLRALGMDRKLVLGSWFKPALKALRAMRRVRGTRFDPFGLGSVRRLERELVVEYETALGEVMRHLVPEKHGLAVDIAALPDMVRGYEQIKVDNVVKYRARLAEMLETMAGPPAAPLLQDAPVRR